MKLSEHVRNVLKRLEDVRFPMNAERRAKIQNELKQLFKAIQTREVPIFPRYPDSSRATALVEKYSSNLKASDILDDDPGSN